MSAIAEHCKLDNELTLRDPSASPLTLRAVDLMLTKQEDTLSECRLTFEVSPELYRRIDTEALFNLKPQLRGPFSAGPFQPEPDIQIEATLQPDLLPHLTNHTANPLEAAAYLQNLCQEQPDNPLLSVESWFGVHIKQLIESGEIGYRTLWSYVSLSVITQEAASRGQISQAMINFFKDWADAEMSAVTEAAISESVEEITKAFEELADTGLAVTEEAISEIFEEVTSAFEELTEAATEAYVPSATSKEEILPTIVNFFTYDDWPFAKIKGEPALRMIFGGKNGKWTCYAKARPEQAQFVFYSICPVNVPENKRLAIAEFIALANYGTVIGNFELDFASGEIRYKTSIDVEGSTLTFPQIKQLVYTNVMMMDQYLPGIMSVIAGGMEVKDAIAQIES